MSHISDYPTGSNTEEFTFNTPTVTAQLVEWCRTYFNGFPDKKAIIGISGGVDSSVAAAILVKSLGKERVFGVLMPCGIQDDIQCSYDLCNHLGIDYIVVDIESQLHETYESILEAYKSANKVINFSTVTTFNTPARQRMATLYAIAGSENGLVINTCNLAEDWVGYSTKFGDNAGDVSLLRNFVKCEVRAIGRELELPKHLIEKTPTDGLCGKTDEQNLGFTYDILDRYIRTGICEDAAVKAKINALHTAGLHKVKEMPYFKYGEIAI